MRKIRNKNFAVSPAVVKEGRVHLLHIDDLDHTGSRFARYIQEEHSLRQVINPDVEFFYTIENCDSTDVNSRKVIHVERGLAHVERDKEDFFLVRDVILEALQQGDDDLVTLEDGSLDFPDDTYLIVGSYIPANYIELYYKEHSVICSTEPLTPSPVEISENSLLGRLDGEIKSIDSKDLSFILTPDYVVNSLKDNNDPILVATKHFEMLNDKSKLLTGHVVLKSRPSKPRNREKGSIIFNSSTNSLEFFDGSKWKTIKTEN